MRILQQRPGRLIFNGYPTGVEVSSSMVHGGPFPAASDGRGTSAGIMAIHRFGRAVAWQAFSRSALPAEPRDDNPLGISRMATGIDFPPDNSPAMPPTGGSWPPCADAGRGTPQILPHRD